jgi:hypothetical protein
VSVIDTPPIVGNRIVVTGMAGAGKSTFSRTLSTKTGLPVIHLDLHSWNPGWVRVPEGEFLEKQRALLAGSVRGVRSDEDFRDLAILSSQKVVMSRSCNGSGTNGESFGVTGGAENRCVNVIFRLLRSARHL